MRAIWRAVLAGVLVAVAASTAPVAGQVPGAGGAPPGAGVPGAVAPTPPVNAATATGVVGEPGGKVGFFKRVCIALDECRRKICKTPAGQLLNNATKPLSAMTGGIIPPFCPLMPNAKDLAQPGVSGAAAAAQKEVLEAKARRDAVRFLGTLDCRYFPGVPAQLAAALRMDSSECVRFEAAIVLGRGCCCSEITIKALSASVSGTDADGAPAERSVRVRCAAAVALERCLSCYVGPAEEVEEPKKTNGGGEVTPPGEIPSGPTSATGPTPRTISAPAPAPDAPGRLPPTVLPPGDQGNRAPSPKTVARARQILDEFQALLAAYQPPAAVQASFPPAGRQDVYSIVKAASDAFDTQAPVAMTQAQPVVVMSAPPPIATPAPAGVRAPAPAPTQVAERPAPPAASPPAGRPTAAGVPQLMPAPDMGPVPTPGRAIAEPPPVRPAPVGQVTPPTPRAPVTPAASSQPPAPLSPAVAAARVTTADEEVNTLTRQLLAGATQGDRHAAIRQLVRYDWRHHPMVAAALLAGAKGDPSNVVRVDCLRHLAAYKVTHPQVLADVAALSSDADTWVRQEAEQALDQLKAGR